MKKILYVLLILLTSFSLSFSKEKLPADVKAVSDRLIKLTTDYFKSIGSVKNANELTTAINRYADGLEKLTPQIKALEAKYGKEDEQGEESEDDSDDMNDYDEIQEMWAEQLSGADMNIDFEKLSKFSTDPGVQKAMERLNSVMEKAGLSDEEESGEELSGEDEGDIDTEGDE